MAEAVSTPVPSGTSIRPVLVLAGICVAVALYGAMAQRQAAPAGTLALPASRAAVYLGLIALEGGLALYVWRAGLRRSLPSLGALIGGRWGSPRDVAVDAGIAVATWGGWTAASRVWVAWSGPDAAASVQTLLPQRPLEIALWIALSLSAGFSEELVFRGYLQKRFEGLTGSVAPAVLLQAVLFGVSHGYQGVHACLRITVYGLLFGGLAAWRRSLRPGMIAHAWTDIASGILGF